MKLSRQSQLEDELERRILGSGLPPPQRQFLFSKDVGRKHRFDFAWPEFKIAAEVDGGTHMAKKGVAVGHHASTRDYRKRNLAAKLGWRVLAYRPEMIRSGDAVFDLSLILRPPDGPAEFFTLLRKREAYNLAQESAAQRLKKLKLGAKRRGR